MTHRTTDSHAGLRLQAEATAFLRQNRKRWPTIQQMLLDQYGIDVSQSWLSKLVGVGIPNPSVNRIEAILAIRDRLAAADAASRRQKRRRAAG